MKTKVILILSLVWVLSGSVFAQCYNGTKMGPIYADGKVLVDEMDKGGYETVRLEYDLIFTSKSSWRSLSSDWEYVIMGFADGGVKVLTLDLYVWDESASKYVYVKSDDGSNKTAPIVTVLPPTTQDYKIVVTVKEFYSGYNAAKYGLIFVHK